MQQELPKPEIKDNEVLVRTHAAGLNPVDVKTRKGKGQAARLKAENPKILGWDISGEVVEVGKNVTRFKTGDNVFGMINLPGVGKAYAEYVAAPESDIAIKPQNISHEEAAAASLAAMTAWQALVDQAQIKAGQKILIHAAAGGVGHYAVQIAKHFGAYVIGTSSKENKNLVISIGADEHIDYKAVRFEDVCREVDVILETIGGENIDRSLKVLKTGGTIVSLPSGVSEDVKDKAAAQNKNGIFFFVKSNAADMEKIAALLVTGEIKSHVSKRFSFDQIREAHELLESGKTVGKMVLIA
ncbi:MAG: NADP-dependent oxidoreductase [Chitinophagaceae bacterium]|nr:MAG: NADP-dependent oxidoreductase [Chitinophagaceae bacterium]